MWGTPTIVTESATGRVNGGATATLTRTTQTSYDAADRVTAVQITGTGTGSVSTIAKTVTDYDPATGDVTAIRTVNSGGTTTAALGKTYDALGRLTSYTDATGAATTTTYDRYGNPDTVTQAMNGKTVQTVYGYADARGYLTSITEKVNGSVSVTIGAEWGPDGQLTKGPCQAASPSRSPTTLPGCRSAAPTRTRPAQ